MVLNSRRAFHRNKSETPVRYEKIEEEKFFDSKIVDFSRAPERESLQCEICGDFVPPRNAKRAFDRVCLCPRCHRRYKALPEGIIKLSVERFLIGNVL